MKKRKTRIAKDKIVNMTVIICFAVVIYVPNLLVPVASNFFDLEWGKNEKEYEAPVFVAESFEKYPSNFDKYYNNSLPFRDAMGAAWAGANYFLLGDSVNRGVVLGKVDGENDSDRWLFYSDDEDNNPIKDAQGVTKFTEKQMAAMVENMIDNTTELVRRGIKLYYVVIPSKETIYREMLPDDIIIYFERTRADNFYDYALERGVKNLIYPKEALLAAKSELGQIYYKQDTHWNILGGGVAFNEIMSAIGQKTRYGLKAAFKNSRVGGDLAAMLNIKRYFTDENVSVGYTGGSEGYTLTKSVNNNDVTISENDTAPVNETVLVVGDSYRAAMGTYFFKTYRRCIFMHRASYRPEMLEQYDVDLVLSEYVERYVPGMDKMKLY